MAVGGSAVRLYQTVSLQVMPQLCQRCVVNIVVYASAGCGAARALPTVY